VGTGTGRTAEGWLLLALVALAAGGAACSPEPELHRANLVVVVVDALRADHLGAYGYGGAPPTSPLIDAWARGGVRFANVVATSSQTVPSTISLLSGAYPRDHGNQYFPGSNSFRSPEPKTRPRIAPDRPLLAEALERAGFRTGAIVANPWLKAEYGFARGFGRYRYLEKPAGHAYVRGPRLNELAREFLAERRGERFFLYLHYMDVHSPYTPPPEHRAAFVGDRIGRAVRTNGPAPRVRAVDVEFTRRLYAAEVRGFDDLFGELLAMLDEAGVADSTLVVLLADHGDEFREHGGMGHGRTLFEEVVRVPWVLVHPDLRGRAGVLDVPASGVDVAPTLLGLLGVEGDLGGEGRSLADAIRDGAPVPAAPRFSELAELKTVTGGGRKVIAGPGADPVRAYDLHGDPGEAAPAPPDAPWAERLEEQLSDWLAEGVPDDVGTAAPAADDPDLERQLRELGYIAEPEPAPPEPEPSGPEPSGGGGS